MIAGHAAIGFLVAALAGFYLDVEPEGCITLGLFAAAFAALPDIDLIFASGEILAVFTSGMGGFVESFWEASSAFHRGITHSLVTLAVSTVAFILYRERESVEAAAALVFVLTSYGLVFAGFQAAMVMAVFSLAGIALSHYSVGSLQRREFVLAAFAGLMSHPFVDIFTGVPPSFLFPLDINFLGSRLVLNQDPVLNLLSIILMELSLLFLAVLTAILLKEDELRSHLTPAPLLGFLYVPLYFVVPEPTLSSAYTFVLVAVGLGVLANILAHRLNGMESEVHVINMHGLNFVLAVIAASISYTAVYLLI